MVSANLGALCSQSGPKDANRKGRNDLYNTKYAFGVVCTFGKIWMERALINSKGKDSVHKELIT